MEQTDHFLEGPALFETGSLCPEPASQGSGRCCAIDTCELCCAENVVLITEPASQGSGRGCENLARLQEEVCPLTGKEPSEWAELKVRLALGRDRTLLEKRCWLEVCTSSPLGRHTKRGSGQNPACTAWADTAGNPAEPPVHSLSGYCRRPGSTSSVSTLQIHRSFSKTGSSWKILVCSNFSCLGNHQDADSAEMVQNFAITDCS